MTDAIPFRSARRRLAMFCLALACVSSLPLVESGEPIRLWVDAFGNHSVEASLVASDADFVRLKRKDGGVVTVELRRLSDPDREYVRRAKRLSTGGTNPLRVPPAESPTIEALPVLDLPPSRTARRKGTGNLELTDAGRDAKSTNLPAALRADPAPWATRTVGFRVPLQKIDVYDDCSAPVPLFDPRDRSPNATVALSVTQGIPTPGSSVRSKLLSVDPETQLASVVWQGDQSLRLFDYHVPSGQGLGLLGADTLGNGGSVAALVGWKENQVRPELSREVAQTERIGAKPNVRWARWVDEDHFVAAIDDTLGMWELSSGRQVYRVGGVDTRSQPAISGGRRYLAVPEFGGVTLRRSTDGVSLGFVPTHPGGLAGVSFSPQGDALAITQSRSIFVWELQTASVSAEVSCRGVVGKRPPVWVDHDLILSGTGVLVSRFRGAAVWRYEMTGTESVRIGDHIVILRRDPQSELSAISFPHSTAAASIRQLDASASVRRTAETVVPGRSLWSNGDWEDNALRVGSGVSPRR